MLFTAVEETRSHRPQSSWESTFNEEVAIASGTVAQAPDADAHKIHVVMLMTIRNKDALAKQQRLP